MNLSERQRRFVDEAKVRFEAGRNARVSRLFGVSNSAKIIEGGIQLGVPNLNSAGAGDESFIFNCVMKFPPEDEVYFSILVRSDKAALIARLEEMKRLGTLVKTPAAAADDDETEEEGDEGSGQPEGIRYSGRNNLVSTYIAHDGKLYFRNAGFWNSLNFDLSTVGPGVEPDKILVSLFPPSASARRSLLAREFVGYLGSLVGPERVHEVNVWPDISTVSAAMQRMPKDIPLQEIDGAVAALGGYYPGGEVGRFHAALNFLDHKHFVILSGLSGTGKTQLALKYARAVHGVTSDTGDDPLLFVCPVRPEWTDPTGLTGYFDVLSGQYVVPPFLEAVLVATAQRKSPVFVILDEMNLARVEYYFSDVLSCIETQGALQLHSNSVPVEGSTGSPIRAEIPLPHNLFVIGTINVDETTNPISDKILDRASVIDMSNVDLRGFIDSLSARSPDLLPSCTACRDELGTIHDLLSDHGLAFGYRVAEEFIRYHAFAVSRLAADEAGVIDDLLLQKVLVKLRGGEPQRALLSGLVARFGVGRPRSAALVNRLTADLDEFGSFQAAR